MSGPDAASDRGAGPARPSATDVIRDGGACRPAERGAR